MHKQGRQGKRRRSDLTAVANAAANNATLPSGRLTNQGIKGHTSLDAVHQGRGTDAHMAELARSLNMSMALCSVGICRQLLPEVEEAQEYLVIAAEESRRVGHWSITDTAFKIIGRALTRYDDQLERATQAQIRTGGIIVARCLKRGNIIRVKPQQPPSALNTQTESRSQ